MDEIDNSELVVELDPKVRNKFKAVTFDSTRENHRSSPLKIGPRECPRGGALPPLSF